MAASVIESSIGAGEAARGLSCRHQYATGIVGIGDIMRDMHVQHFAGCFNTMRPLFVAGSPSGR
jgi:hypothetical protein